MPASISTDNQESHLRKGSQTVPHAPRKAAKSASQIQGHQLQRVNQTSGPLIHTEGPDPDTPLDQVRLAVGVIVGSHGVAGEIKIRPVTDQVAQFTDFRFLYLGSEETPRRVKSFRMHGNWVLLRLTGVSTPEHVQHLRGTLLRAPVRDLRPLQDDEYFFFQLIGLRAKTEIGEDVGIVVDIIETGAADVFVIEPIGGGTSILVPNRPEFVLRIAPAEMLMVVRLLDYLD
ncbi:hypothetical protein BH23CHL5_BH23CHL5_05930 [soil metagenome]